MTLIMYKKIRSIMFADDTNLFRGGLAQGAGVRLHPGPPPLLKRGPPWSTDKNLFFFVLFLFLFCFTVEKQENMLGPGPFV